MWTYALLACENGLTYPYKISPKWEGVMFTLMLLRSTASKREYETEHDMIPANEPDKPDYGLLENECNLGSLILNRFEDGTIEYILWRVWME